ncbi:MAG: C-GCAxxG-C-C family protein [candidate division Zixibacteria bacterium]
MTVKNIIAERVHHLFWDKDWPCVPAVLTIYKEIFKADINDDVIAASRGLNGGGQYGAQCGLLEANLMFIALLGKERDYTQEQINELCAEFSGCFEKKFKSLLCREIRPEGFVPENPPHLCETRTVDSMLFALEFYGDKMNLTPIVT